MHPRHFRLRFLLGIFSKLVVPQLLLWSALRISTFSLPQRVLLHIVFIPVTAALGIAYSSRTNRRHAASLGATPVPCVQGKWPGNIDIALRRVRAIRDDYLSQYTADLFKEYKTNTLNFRILWTDQIITVDEMHVKYMLTGDGFPYFPKGYWWQERFETFLGNGIFNRDGEEWQNHRQIARPWFVQDRISDFNIFEKHTSETINLISNFARSNTPFDAQDLVGRFTLDAASEFLFGRCLDTLQGVLPVAGKAKVGPKGSSTDDDFGTFAKSFDDVQVQLGRRLMIGNAWPLFELFEDKTEADSKVVHGWLDPIVARALQDKADRLKDGGKNLEDGQTLLSHLTDSTDDAVLIRNQIVNMLLAGKDTTAAALTFVIYFLAIYPDIMDRVREEVLDQHGFEGSPSLETIKNSAYPSANNPHIFPATQSSPKYYIPPDSQVVYNILLIQRRKELWGDDADEFKPSRWLDTESLKRITNNPSLFIPFHAGPRICLGQKFALNEISFFMVRLVQKFKRFHIAADAQPEGTLPREVWKSGHGRQITEKIWPAAATTTFVKGGLWIRAESADE
ncbi:cytochrome P450 [Mycena floridula]|nr:cytochrome P450 [Mycena floridula]